jgi:hypothetical protein
MQPLPTDLLGVGNGNPDVRLLRVPTAAEETMQELSASGLLSYLSAADFGATNRV